MGNKRVVAVGETTTINDSPARDGQTQATEQSSALMRHNNTGIGNADNSTLDQTIDLNFRALR